LGFLKAELWAEPMEMSRVALMADWWVGQSAACLVAWMVAKSVGQKAALLVANLVAYLADSTAEWRVALMANIFSINFTAVLSKYQLLSEFTCEVG